MIGSYGTGWDEVGNDTAGVAAEYPRVLEVGIFQRLLCSGGQAWAAFETHEISLGGSPGGGKEEWPFGAAYFHFHGTCVAEEVAPQPGLTRQGARRRDVVVLVM